MEKKKRKKKKKGDHWGVDKQTKHPWDIDVDMGDEPKVAAIGVPYMRGERDPAVRRVKREGKA